MAFSMSEQQLVSDLNDKTSFKILRSGYAALIISFLHQEFKQAQRASVPYTELIEHL